jgi:ribonuclease HI
MLHTKNCRHCGSPLIIKQTRRTPEQLTKQYYYTAYRLCPKCGRMYHSDEFKVVNENYDLFSGKHAPSGDLMDVEIWTDGACVHNGTEKASAAWAFVSGIFEKAGRVEGKQTNNRGEAEAILRALEWAAEKGERRVKILTDSQISIHGVMKAPEKVLANRDIFENIAKVVRDNSMEVVYEKVLGHSGVQENERVDKLANGMAVKNSIRY